VTAEPGGVPKHSTRIEALGSLDELNSFLGFLHSLSEGAFKDKRDGLMKKMLQKVIEQVQKDLFVTGAELSRSMIKSNSIPHPLRHHYPKNSYRPEGDVPRITTRNVIYLEELIDDLQKHLPPLKNFILPQGTLVGSFSQVIRAVSRRVERRVVQLAMNSKVNPLILAYLNRLSDLLFLLARSFNYTNNKGEIIWRHNYNK